MKPAVGISSTLGLKFETDSPLGRLHYGLFVKYHGSFVEAFFSW
jgi:hypothetical protein